MMKEFVGLRAKTSSYLIDDGSEGKRAKGTKKCVIKRKLKLEDYKNCLEAAQLESKRSHLEKNKIDEDHKKFIKTYKLILKPQQRFKSERHDVFIEEINKIVLSSNDDERMNQLILWKHMHLKREKI